MNKATTLVKRQNYASWRMESTLQRTVRSRDANQLLSGEYTGSFYFDGRSKKDRVELIFHDKGGDGGRTFIIDEGGCNEFGHYIVTGEFDPRHSTVSMQRQLLLSFY